MSGENRLSVGVIGAGRVGPIIAAAFAGAGHTITGITSGDSDHLNAVLPGVPELGTEQICERSTLVVIAVPSAELPALVAGLAAVDAWQPGQLVLHTDPGYGVDVLRPAAAHGAIPLAVHPAMSFTGTTLDLRQLRDSYAAVTAPTTVLPIAQALAVELGCEPVVVTEEDRPAYAEAIATATTFSDAIIRQSASLLAAIGVDAPERYLSSLVHSTVDRALQEAGAPGDDLPSVPGGDD